MGADGGPQVGPIPQEVEGDAPLVGPTLKEAQVGVRPIDLAEGAAGGLQACPHDLQTKVDGGHHWAFALHWVETTLHVCHLQAVAL